MPEAHAGPDHGSAKPARAKRAKRATPASDAPGTRAPGTRASARRAPAAAANTAPSEKAGFPVVGIGASAGGLGAIEAFLRAIPSDRDIGLAFVIVQHLDPDHESILLDLVKQYTHLPVHAAVDGATVKPGHVYVMPRKTDMAIFNGRLQLLEPSAPRGLRLPIDYFFRSLAQDQGERAVSVVLSGTGTDGTLGVKEVKGQGGMVMVQEPETAGYDGMPRSAIATGLVDYVLTPEHMPEQLLAFVDSAFHAKPRPRRDARPETDSLQKLLLVLRDQTGHDFSQYKKNTVRRRVERRMAVTQVERLEDYVRYLRQKPQEAETLFRELLIGVTTFFRDPPAFEVLMEKALVPLLAAKRGDTPLRVWVPACSTGEEAYSIAIMIKERLEALQVRRNVQLFATDIDLTAIETARSGVYLESIAADVTPARLERFFTRDGSTLRVTKSVRDLLVFAKQDVAKDPPFSKVDLISCRNLLIYMDGALQKKVLALFNYALSPGGYLFLGTSETVGDAPEMFVAVDKKWRLYQQRAGQASRMTAPGPRDTAEITRRRPAVAPARRARTEPGLRDQVERALLEDFSPPCVIVDEGGDVLYIHGHVGKYLEPPPGEVTSNLLRMARRGLRLELSTGMRRVLAGQSPVRYEGLTVQTNGDTATVNLELRLLQPRGEAAAPVMVLFEEAPEPPQQATAVGDGSPDDLRVAELENELRAKEEYLQSTVEELETSNEELQSTNEEMQSANEELQSTNEELETSKEELQSVNEELVTVNNELQQKIDELSRVNNDMNNLMAGTGIGTVFVDSGLLIQRFTPAATRLISLIKTDVGRPVSDIASLLVGHDHLIEDIRAVLDTLQPQETEVQTAEGQWFLMRIQPYRTVENYIEGAVLTFVEITRQHELQDELQRLADRAEEARDYAESVVEAVGEPLLTLDADLRLMSANRSFLTSFELTAVATQGVPLFDLDGGVWDVPELRRRLATLAHRKGPPVEISFTREFPRIGRRTVNVSARRLRPHTGGRSPILLTITDVSER